MKSEKNYLNDLTVPFSNEFSMDQINPADNMGIEDKNKAITLLKKIHKELNPLQEILYAQGKFAVLIIFQAMDNDYNASSYFQEKRIRSSKINKKNTWLKQQITR